MFKIKSRPGRMRSEAIDNYREFLEQRVLGSWTSKRSTLTVIFASAIVAASHLVLRTGFVLDDWYSLANARFEGMWHASEVQASARPGQWLIGALTFGVFGRHPVPYVVLAGLLSGLTAVALLFLLRRFLPESAALAVALLWVVVPNHMSMEIWASALQVGIAVLAMLVGFNVGLRENRSRAATILSSLLLLMAVLSYEVTAPMIVVGVVVLPRVLMGRFDRVWISTTGALLGAAGLWMLISWNPNKEAAWNPGTLTQAIPAHFGWGVAPEGAAGELLMVIALTVSVLAVSRLISAEQRSRVDWAEWCVISGWIVIALGTVPFLLYIYGPIGAGDRANCVSSIGGALVLVGGFRMIWDLRHEVALAAALLVLVAMGISRVERSATWATAFGDADRILAGAHTQIPNPTGTIVFGPAPIQRTNIAAFLDQSNIDSAVRVEYDDPDISAGITYSVADFQSFPPEQRVEIGPFSRLRPDVDLSSD